MWRPAEEHVFQSQAEGERGDDEEVDGHDVVEMGREEGAPRRRRTGDCRRMYLATVSSASS